MTIYRLRPTARRLIQRRTLSSISNYNLNSPSCNVTEHIAGFVGRNLHRQPNHPLHILSSTIVDYFTDYRLFDDLSPIVSTKDNFDRLRIEADHPSRSISDTYYLNESTVLRTHTSAHQIDLLRQGYSKFLVAGDVYRRDEIDRSHYPIFHQMEGVRLFSEQELAGLSGDAQVEWMLHDLQSTLQGLAQHLFGEVQHRWVDEYFPFTHPSLELEIDFAGDWMEVLGCGVIHPAILQQASRDDEPGWAFGLGLERLAMVLFQIPDIRLFWTSDQRFHQQFQSGQIVQFEPYSKYPPCYKDISFWLPADYHVNDLNESIRGVAGDLVEQVSLMDEFAHPKTSRVSHCYRIAYRSMDRSLTNEEIDELQEQVRDKVAQMGAELR